MPDIETRDESHALQAEGDRIATVAGRALIPQERRMIRDAWIAGRNYERGRQQIVADHGASERERALREALEAARIPHLRVPGDPWFDCEMAKREDTDDPTDYPTPRCDCGAEEHNAKIDAALTAGGAPESEHAIHNWPFGGGPCMTCHAPMPAEADEPAEAES